MQIAALGGEGQDMSLYQNIELDMKNALKQGDALKLSVLRILMSVVKRR